MVKNPLPMQETGAQSLGQEDPLEKEIEIHSSILAWKISWKEEPGRLQLEMTKELNTHTHTHTHTHTFPH